MKGKAIGVRPADSITQAAMKTIWRDRLIVGALNLIAGQPGAGKSTLAATIAGELSRQGRTLIISNAEDDAGSVTVPRLVVAGAILDRVHVIEPEDAPLFPRDYELLEAAITASRCACTILDPIASHYKPERRVHDRETLRQLAGIARRTGSVILGLHHTTKDGEIGGPNAGLRGTARAVYVYGFDPDDEDRRALSVDKINGVEDPATLLFEHEASEYELGETTIVAGRLRKVRHSNAHASTRRGRRDPERDAACHAWLTEYLAAGEDCARSSNDVKAGGVAEGYGEATLRRAKTELQVEHVRVGGWGADGHWTWRLPDDHPARTPELDEASDGR